MTPGSTVTSATLTGTPSRRSVTGSVLPSQPLGPRPTTRTTASMVTDGAHEGEVVGEHARDGDVGEPGLADPRGVHRRVERLQEVGALDVERPLSPSAVAEAPVVDAVGDDDDAAEIAPFVARAQLRQRLAQPGRRRRAPAATAISASSVDRRQLVAEGVEVDDVLARQLARSAAPPARAATPAARSARLGSPGFSRSRIDSDPSTSSATWLGSRVTFCSRTAGSKKSTSAAATAPRRSARRIQRRDARSLVAQRPPGEEDDDAARTRSPRPARARPHGASETRCHSSKVIGDGTSLMAAARRAPTATAAGAG